MTSHTFLSTSPLSQTFALALVASTLPPFTLAQNRGTDAPATGTDPPPVSSGDDAAAENAAGAAGAENSGISKKSQTIIGVVVGVVVLGASKMSTRSLQDRINRMIVLTLSTVIAAILFFLAKKRQWDRQTKRYEALNNAYRSSAKYRARVGGRSYHELSLRQHRRWPGASVVDDSPETSTVKKSPLGEPLLPVYDPSTYHRHQLSSGYGYGYDRDRGASFDLPRAPARTRYSSTITAAAAMPSNQPHYSNKTTTTTTAAAVTTTTGSVVPPPYSSHMTTSGPGSSAGTSETQSPPLPAVESGTDSGPRPPRRPKPVLARLITDL